MMVLGIETSCDETSAAIVAQDNILSNVVATQEIHQRFGGVVPEFASRAHLRQLPVIIQSAMSEANVDFSDLQGLAVTYGPGLAGSLLVGLSMCKALAFSLHLPFIGINHLEGHILATSAESRRPDYPCLALVVSGGHTLLVLVEKPLCYKIVGQTIDDAAGEAFDKVSKILNLGYPGGPAIEKAAISGDDGAIHFPIGLAKKNNLDFSFSGLKTAVLYHVQSLSPRELQAQKPDIAAGFQRAVIDALLNKTLMALEIHNCRQIVLAGGVVRNQTLRNRFQDTCEKNNLELFIPSPKLCTDNAAMIARAGTIRLQNGEKSAFDLDVIPNLSLDPKPKRIGGKS